MPEVEETRELVTMLGRQDRPIIVGPWLTETGFELLYWIPFLAWAKAYGSLHDDQLIVVSRGGAAPWYRHITSNYHDILSLYGADEFRQRNEARIHEQRGRFKHVDVGEFDREIVERVKRARGLGSAKLLHPSLMYNLFSVFWRQQAPMTLVEAFSVFRSLPELPLGDLAAHLPREYVAVKFYANAALPDSAAKPRVHRQDAGRAHADHRRRAAQHRPALRRSLRLRGDQARTALHSVEHLMTPETNLEVQTRIICGAKAFVGTYGGFSYLAPFYGIDTVAFFSHPTAFRFDHLEVSKRVFSSLRAGSFVPLDVRDVGRRPAWPGRTRETAAAGGRRHGGVT